MTLFLNLYLGHLLGDFLFQPGRLVAAKRASLRGLAVHVLILAASTALVLGGDLGRYWPITFFVLGMHLVIEEVTILAYTKTPTRPLYTFLFDQALHVLSIALLVFMWGENSISPDAVTFGLRISTITLAMIASLGTVTLFGSILAFEVGNTALEGNASKGRLLRLDWPRIGGMAERGGALALALFVHPVLILLPFVPRVVRAVRSGAGLERKRGLIEATAGLLTCAAGWAATVVVRIMVDPAYLGVWWRLNV